MLDARQYTTQEFSLNLKDWANQPIDIDNIVKYGWVLGAFFQDVANKIHLHKNNCTRTVFVDAEEKIGFTDFDLDEDQHAFLAGRSRGDGEISPMTTVPQRAEGDHSDLHDMAPSD
jgi:hypothetical protein